MMVVLWVIRVIVMDSRKYSMYDVMVNGIMDVHSNDMENNI